MNGQQRLFLSILVIFLSLESISQGSKRRQIHNSQDKFGLIHSSKNKHSNVEPFEWNISKTHWGLGAKGTKRIDEENKEVRARKESMNRRRKFNRPPKGGVVVGSPNVNKPGYFSSSAYRPNSLGCIGSNCHHPSPNTFYRPAAPGFVFRGKSVPTNSYAPYTNIYK